MKNGIIIGEISRQLKRVCDRIEELTMSIEILEQYDDAMSLFEDQRFDELEHLQQLTLRITELIATANETIAEQTANADSSVFAAGELNHKKGDMTQDGLDVEEGTAPENIESDD